MNQFELQLQVRIQPRLKGGGYSSEGLTITEIIVVQARDFMEACKIIGQFHDLAGKVKAE